MRSIYPAKHQQRAGFALIEVLITVVVISFGLLSIANLQLAAKRNGFEAIQRTKAILLANDMLERIRANASGTANYHTGAASPLGGGALGNNRPTCATAPCTPAEIASQDLWDWERQLDRGNVNVDGANLANLINPQGCITYISQFTAPDNGSGSVRIVLSWQGLTNISDAVVAGGPICGDDPANPQNVLNRHQIVLDTYVTSPLDLNR